MKGLKSALLLSCALAVACAPCLADGWENDLAVADSLYDNGYYEAAIEDYQKIIATYVDQTPAVDRAWAGLGRAYHVTGNVTAAKVALEKCLELDQDAEATTSARELYRQIKDEATHEREEMEHSLEYFEQRYRYTSWLNIITKVFDFFDLRKAKKRYTSAFDYENSFDPRYLIDPVKIAGVGDPDKVPTTLEPDLQKLIDEAGDKTPEVADDKVGGDDDVKFVGDDAPMGEPVPVTTTSPNVTLKEKRDAYLQAYRSLQDALRGKNQLEIQQANEVFQKAVTEYKAAQQAVSQAQGR